MDWIKITLGELCNADNCFIQTGPFGSQLHESDYSTEGIPVIMPKDINSSKIDISSIARVRENHVNRLKRHMVKKNDIIYGRRGDIGRQALVRDRESGWLCGTGCLLIRPDQKRVKPFFLHYYLKQASVINYISNQAIGATLPNLNTTILKNLPIYLPSLPTQQKIAAILLSYDELIENNNRRIVILEKMAKEIYREWFIRMRFPGYEKAKSIKGVPEGWKVVKVNEIVNRLRFGKIYRENDLNESGKVIVIDQSEKDYLGFYDGAPEYISSYEKPIIIFGDHTCKIELMLNNFSLAENVIPFISKHNIDVIFLYFLIKGIIETTEYKRHWTEFVNKQVLLPLEAIQQSFTKITKPLVIQRHRIVKCNMELSKIRDLLLPRLINGKLSIENLDIKFPPGVMEDDAQRKRLRLTGYDYSRNGAYFITTCVKNRDECFGMIRDGKIILNQYGEIVRDQWAWLFRQYSHVVGDEYVIMPDHIHGILIIDNNLGGCGDVFVGNGRDRSLQKPSIDDSIRQNRPSVKPLPQIIGAFKTTSSKLIHLAGNDAFQWQKSYYDRIIRNEEELIRIRHYIANNPALWEQDKNLTIENISFEVEHV